MNRKQAHSVLLLMVISLPLLFLWLGLRCLHPHGFTVEKISSNLEYNSDWESPSLSREHTDFLLHEVFNQPYHYLASGSLCYAFLSQDQRFVLKFFKMQNLITKQNSFSFVSSIFPKAKQESSLRFPFFDRIFTSYLDAYQELRRETGLLYVHFNKTHDLKKQITLIDNLGKKHKIDLDRMEFVVQRKAEKFCDTILQFASEQQQEKARDAFRAFFKLIAARSKKGFSAHGLTVRNNFGFCGDEAIQIDCGTLARDELMKYPSNFREEILLLAERLNQWAQIVDPDLCLLVQEEAQRVINESSF